MSTLSNRIRELRTEKELTQKEFGKLFGIVKSTVSLYESGKSAPDDETKKKIAQYFNVSLDYLMGVSDVKNPYSEKSIEEEYKEEIQALEKFRQVMINKGLDYENKTYEELAEIVVKHIKVQDILNSDNSKSN